MKSRKSQNILENTTIKKIGLGGCIIFLAVMMIPKGFWGGKQKIPSRILGITRDATSQQSEVLGIKASPELASTKPAPKLGALSSFAFDPQSGTILYANNFDHELPIASLTKLMTALIVLKSASLDQVVAVKKSTTQPIGNSMGLVAGERITVGDLLKGMLISSSNDAALTLADFVSGDAEKFVERMNIEAGLLNLNQTRFSNPVGYDSKENYSTAHDLSRLVSEVIKNPVISQIVKTRETTVASTDGKISHKLTSTNKLLLTRLNITGIKTGFTSQSQGSLIVRMQDGNKDIVTIILGSPDRETDSEKLLDWVLSVYNW
ncbi:MAG: D-alanyl-D-alanine carboxypeptidase [Candidatus Doudnabacteria bacterium]|nr:D-alanyl-D-alanine carboxypeptidase [Candidatus Doudnabacteria bacterium]